MKILIVSSLGYIGGGAESLISLVKPELENKGHEVRIFTSNEHPEIPHFSDYEFESFHTHPFAIQMVEKLFYPKAYFSLRKVLKSYNPDLVHIHTTELLSPSVLFAVKKYPTIVTVHGPEEYLPSLMLWGFPTSFFKNGNNSLGDLNMSGWIHYLYHLILSKNIFRVGFKNVDEIVVPSLYMKNAIKKEGYDGSIVKDATKLFKYSPIDPSSRTIAYVGRLEKCKGLQYVIEALPKIIETYPDIQLSIAGRGSYGDKLKQLVSDSQVQEHVEFKGNISREAVNELYKSSVVALVPSEWPEPFGLVGIEAMSIGRPVVGTNVGGIPEWLEDGVAGFIVEPRDPNAISGAVLKLMGNQKKLLKISSAARKSSEAFSIEEHALALVKLYKKVIRDARK